MSKRRPAKLKTHIDGLANASSFSSFRARCSRHPIALFSAVSLLWVLLLYSRSLGGPFVYDDVLAIQENSNLTSWQGVAKYFTAPVPLSEEYRGYAGSFYRPVYWMSLFLDRSAWGLNPVGFHVTNLLLHWANGLLGFLLLRRLHVKPMAAAATCLIWLGLPISSEVVAWISGRPASLVVFFFLLNALAALRWVEVRKPAWLLASLVALGAALLSNESAVVAIPLTVFLLLLETRRATTGAAAIIGGYALVLGAYLIARNAAGAHLPSNSLAIFPVGISLLKYIQWIVFPLGLSVERSSETPPNALSGAAIAALVAAGALVGFIVWARRSYPQIASGVTWMLIALAPFSGFIFIYQGMAERYTYLASAGLVFAMVAAAGRMPSRFRPIAIAALAVWLFWGAYRLHARVEDWRDETTLFQSSLVTSPHSAVLLYNLGVAAGETEQLDKAAEYYRRALRENPGYVSALINLGSVLHRQGQDAESRAYLHQAAELSPKSPEPWVDLGNIYLQQGSLDSAQDAYRKALSLDPNNLAATMNLGAAMQTAHDFTGAEKQYRKAIELNPRSAAAYCALGAILLRQMNAPAAIEAFQKATDVEPDYSAAYFDLGVAQEGMGRSDLAAQMYAKVLELQPDHQKARARLEALRSGR